MNISPSTYCKKARKSRQTLRSQSGAALLKSIQKVLSEWPCYGYRRVTAELRWPNNSNGERFLVHEGGFGIGKAVTGSIHFTDPAGQIIPTGPDTRSRGNFLSLFTDHEQSGIHITPKTAQSLWLGERMDDQLAVEGLLYRE